MVFDPLHSGIREDHIELAIAGRGPPGDVTGKPPLPGILAARALDHFGGTVQPGEFGVRPALAEHRGAVAGSAAEIDHAARTDYCDARGEIAAGLGALCREFQVLTRVPAGHLPTVAPLAGTFRAATVRERTLE